jgi:hypothetical protein
MNVVTNEYCVHLRVIFPDKVRTVSTVERRTLGLAYQLVYKIQRVNIYTKTLLINTASRYADKV